MTITELWTEINNGEGSEVLFYLYERWQDERKYEDIEDYLTHIQRYIPSAYKISKRPFGVTCKCDDGEIFVGVKIEGRYIKTFGKIINNKSVGEER